MSIQQQLQQPHQPTVHDQLLQTSGWFADSPRTSEAKAINAAMSLL